MILSNNEKIKLIPHHVGISIQNMQESIAWYKNVLDFEFLWEKDFPEIKTRIAFLQHSNFKIELFEHYQTQALAAERKHPLTDMQLQGTKHICFETKNVEKLFEQFKEKKVDIVMGPVLSPPKDALMGFIRDNTGNLIEIIELIPC
jgi:methylmalonyl-CoA/ethylmalonyl-CoA epimerase